MDNDLLWLTDLPAPKIVLPMPLPPGAKRIDDGADVSSMAHPLFGRNEYEPFFFVSRRLEFCL